MKLYFKIKAQSAANQILYIVGNTQILGLWDPQKALKLTKKQDNIWQSNDCLKLNPNQKIQFKLIMKIDGNVSRWQSLPNNSNRKFKITQDAILQMQWSSTKGKKHELQRKSLRLRGIPSVVINSPIIRNKKDNKGIFNPFKDAQYSDSDRQQFENQIQNKISQNKQYGRKQFEQIFYLSNKLKSLQNSRIETFQTLFIISRKHPNQNAFSQKILENCLKLKINICWIFQFTETHYKKLKNPKFIPINQERIVNEQNLLQIYQKRLQNLITENSICIIIDITLAGLRLTNSINGLMLGDQNVDKQRINKHILSKRLENIDCVGFYKVQDTEYFLKSALQKIKQSEKSIEIYLQNINTNINLLKNSDNNDDIFFKFYEQMKQQQLQQLKCKKDELKKLNIQQINKAIMESQSCLFIFDFSVIEKRLNDLQYQPFFKNIILLSKIKKNLVCFISEKKKQQILSKFQYFNKSNIVFLADSGKQIKLGHQWIVTLERHMRNIEVLKRKLSEYSIKFNGKIEQNQNFILFSVQKSSNVIQSIHQQLKNLLIQQKYLKIYVKNNELCIAWRLRQQKSTLESIIRLKCMVQGRLDFAFVLTGQYQKDYIFQQLQLLIKNYPNLFKKSLKKSFAIQGIRFCNTANHFLDSQQMKNLNFFIK